MNQLLKSMKQLFQVIKRLIEGQIEICILTRINYDELTWRSTSLLCDKAFEITNAKTDIFSDSRLCLEPWVTNQSKPGRTKSNGIWKSQLKLRIMLTYFRADIVHFWDLDQKRNGTELVNLTEIGTELLNTWCSTLQRAVILYFVPLAPWKEEN